MQITPGKIATKLVPVTNGAHHTVQVIKSNLIRKLIKDTTQTSRAPIWTTFWCFVNIQVKKTCRKLIPQNWRNGSLIESQTAKKKTQTIFHKLRQPQVGRTPPVTVPHVLIETSCWNDLKAERCIVTRGDPDQFLPGSSGRQPMEMWFDSDFYLECPVEFFYLSRLLFHKPVINTKSLLGCKFNFATINEW